jgi:flagellar assembly protein FliH
MTNARKYAFDTEFAPDGAILRDPPRRLTTEQLEAECANAYERGKQDAIAHAEREAAAALEALASAASAVVARLDAESRATRTEAAQLALVAARKIAGAALDAFGEERAAAAIEAAMDMLRHQPRLVVKLSPEAAETLGPRITEMAQTHAYAGAVLVRPQPGLKAGEVVVDWSDGVIAMNPDDAAARIEDMIEAALAAPNAQA